MEEAKKRDHRKLGKELGLFMLTEEGPGFPFFLPKGMVLKNTLIDYWREVHKRYGYVEISTPMILNRKLWERSGHWDHYKQNMYTTVIDDEDYAIKPMNCPGGMLVYKAQPHSYRDLPLRVGELGLVHRHELSGALHGLFRVRCFTQDDAHIFMTRDQMKDEIKNVVRPVRRGLLHLWPDLSYRAVHHAGGPHGRLRRTGSLRDGHPAERHHRDGQGLCRQRGRRRVLRPEAGLPSGRLASAVPGSAAPSSWTMQLPERFELEYTGADGEKHRPVMIHRVVLGSIERFIGVITEHFAGAFPTWLAPEQVSHHADDRPQSSRAPRKSCSSSLMQGFRVTMDDAQREDRL